MKIKIKNRIVKFKVLVKDRHISILPEICIYAEPHCRGWSEWAIHIAWMIWAAGFTVEKNEDYELKHLLKKRYKLREEDK